MKLTRPQEYFLEQVVTGAVSTCYPSYKPAQKLVSLGLLAFTPGRVTS